MFGADADRLFLPPEPALPSSLLDAPVVMRSLHERILFIPELSEAGVSRVADAIFDLT